MKLVKKFLFALVVLFAGFYLITRPEDAADAVRAALLLPTAATVEATLRSRLGAAMDAAGVDRAGLLALETERIILTPDEP